MAEQFSIAAAGLGITLTSALLAIDVLFKAMVVRVAGIGVGGIGQFELAFLSELPEVELVAGADISPGARAVFETEFNAPAYEDYRTLLDIHAGELDGMLIATPHAYHFEQAMASLQAGLHVLLEKPMVIDVGNAVVLADTALRYDRVLQIGYQRHFHPAFQAMKHIIDSGRIGHIHTIASYIGQDWITPHQGTWRVNPDLSGGGQLYDTGSHLLEALVWMLGGIPEAVTASMEYATPGIDVSATLTVRFRRGRHLTNASVAVTGDGVSTDPREAYVIWGSRGCLVFDGHELYVEHKGATRYPIQNGLVSNYDIITREKVRHFVAAITGQEKPVVSVDDSVQVVGLTESAYRADRENRTVDVQETVENARVAPA